MATSTPNSISMMNHSTTHKVVPKPGSRTIAKLDLKTSVINLVNSGSTSLNLPIVSQIPPGNHFLCSTTPTSAFKEFHEYTILFHKGWSSLLNNHHHLNKRVIFCNVTSPTPNPPWHFGFCTTSHFIVGIPLPPYAFPPKKKLPLDRHNSFRHRPWRLEQDSSHRRAEERKERRGGVQGWRRVSKAGGVEAELDYIGLQLL
ncbi:hypothetical protein PIB30_008705 [Stylosanthes scabra]|uniref:Uncharacterized protein n=1 Tax=Stylosanthes scabra TaxID=79078 RepID=A0ABU6U7L5_9FABA|nr:hypothetical protein [Stylosanthes scabra]